MAFSLAKIRQNPFHLALVAVGGFLFLMVLIVVLSLAFQRPATPPRTTPQRSMGAASVDYAQQEMRLRLDQQARDSAQLAKENQNLQSSMTAQGQQLSALLQRNEARMKALEDRMSLLEIQRNRVEIIHPKDDVKPLPVVQPSKAHLPDGYTWMGTANKRAFLHAGNRPVSITPGEPLPKITEDANGAPIAN